MSVVEAMRIAVAAVLSNRLRSGLSVLGIVIGIASVILMVSFGTGTSKQVTSQVQGLGATSIYISPASVKIQGASMAGGTVQTLTRQDVTALSDISKAPDVATVMPVVGNAVTLRYQTQNWQTSVTGSTEAFADVEGYQVATGTNFTADQVRESAKVAVIGQTIVNNLFGGNPDAAVGQLMEVQRQPFRVIGTFASKGSSGSDEDDVVVIPITAAWNYLLGAGGGKNIDQIILQSTSPATVQAAENEATQILLSDHKISNPAQADFQIKSSQDLQQTLGTITGLITALLGGIASISLVVAGIGIMNIMLVTVVERTREIGIRKAIGAKRSAILLQFLIESMILAGGGGLCGVLFGVGIASLADQAFAGSSVPAPVVTAPIVFVSLGVSVGVGLFFGIYPANRAAGLNPIEALRYE